MKPYKFQLEDIEHLRKNPLCGYFADVGVGKTLVTLKTLEAEFAEGSISGALVVSTIRVVESVWRQEAEKWGIDLDFSLVRGHVAKREAALAEHAQVYLINFEQLTWLLTEHGLPEHIDCLVIDESTKLKDTRTGRFKALRPCLSWFKRRHILTGTPAPRSIEDLFGQSFIIDQGAALGQYIGQFRNRYFHKVDRWNWVPREDSSEQIFEALAPTVLRRAADPKVQPKVVTSDIEVPLPAKGEKVYAEFVRDAKAELKKGTVDAVHAAALVTKLRQVCNGYVYHTEIGERETLHSAKFDALEDLIEDLQGEPLLIAYAYDEDAVQFKTAGIPVLTGLSASKAQETIDAWNRGELPVLALHPASAGHGLNLQAGGHHIAFFGLDYNREYYDQAIGRLARTGQECTVYVHRIVTPDSVEDQIAANLAGKALTQKEILEAL